MNIRHLSHVIIVLGILFYPSYIYAKKRDTLSVTSIRFIENKKQWDRNVLFSAQIHNGSIFFENDGVRFVLMDDKQLDLFRKAKTNTSVKPPQYIDAVAYKTKFIGCNPKLRSHGDREYPFYYNYYIGNDPKKWSSNVSAFEEIHYEGLYRGIDLRYYQSGSHLKYEFIIKPGSLPHVIELEYEGMKSLSISGENLIINTAIGSYMELKPYAYQIRGVGDTIPVTCRYKLNKNRVTFDLGEYNPILPLIIDPVLVFSTYTGSTADNWGFTATYDRQGNTYAGGVAFNTGYPTTLGAFQVNYAGGQVDISISKFNQNGTALLFSTYLGGQSTEIPNSLIVNENDELYVLATTSSEDFPITPGVFQTTLNGGTPVTISSALGFQGCDIAIVKFNNSGTQILASTFVGGTGNDGLNLSDPMLKNYADEARGEIMVDNHSNVYVVSSTLSNDFPVTSGVLQPFFGGGSQDACIIKMNHNLTNMIWASYLGGSADDAGYSIDIASDKSIYICGGTNSFNFPVTQNAAQGSLGGGPTTKPDGFVAHIDEFGTQLFHSTYLGDTVYDQTYLLKTDRQGYPHVFGQTSAQGNFWIRNAAWNTPGGGQFITKLNPSLSNIVWSTAFGSANGEPDISPTAFLVDLCSNIYMSGWGGPSVNTGGGTSGLPVTADALQLTTDNNDYYLLCISSDASSLIYATYFGSPTLGDHVDGGTSRFDKKGTVYQAVCAGCQGYDDFPTTPGVWSEVNGSTNCNLAVMKIEFDLPVIVADFIMPNTVCAPASVNFTNTSQLLGSSSSCLWDFGDGTTSSLKNPSHNYNTFGIYNVTLVVSDPNSCNGSDTMVKQITVLANTSDTLPHISLCDGSPLQIGIPPGQDTALTYQWVPTTGLSNPSISNPIVTINKSEIYTLFISNGICFDTLVYVINVVNIDFEIDSIIVCCLGDSVLLNPIIHSDVDYYLWSTSPTFDQIINEDTSIPWLYVAPTSTTTYYFRLGSINCFTTVSVKVQLSQLSLSLPDTIAICPYEQAVIPAQYDCTQCSFNWSPTSSIVSGLGTGTITIEPLTSTSYILEITDINGCQLTDTTVVVVYEDLFLNGVEAWTDSSHIIQGESTTLFSTQYNGGFTYQWSPNANLSTPNAASTTAKPATSTIFRVVITDPNGCPRSDTVHIYVKELACEDPYVYVPNAFTPNRDGVNDILYVRSNIVDYVLFRVYNRWGEKVFESTSLEHGWDGTWKGKEAPAEVYDYYLEVRCMGNRTYKTKGNVTLIR